MQYTIYIERDQFADLQRYPDGIAWRSGIRDENGEEIDGEGDIATYEEARDLAINTLTRLTEPKTQRCRAQVREDYCDNDALAGEDYCAMHKEQFIN